MSHMYAELFYGFYQSDVDDETWEEAVERLEDDKAFVRRMREAFDIQLDTIAQEDYEFVYFLCIVRTRITVNRYSILPINPYHLTIDSTWESLLKGCAKELGIRLHQTHPGWYLFCSSYR